MGCQVCFEQKSEESKQNIKEIRATFDRIRRDRKISGSYNYQPNNNNKEICNSDLHPGTEIIKSSNENTSEELNKKATITEKPNENIPNNGDEAIKKTDDITCINENKSQRDYFDIIEPVNATILASTSIIAIPIHDEENIKN